MNLIFLYGPPAVGKLTTAKELSKITGYPIFHNHLTQDLADEIYPGFCKNKFRLAEVLRLEVFRFIAENDTNLIFTHVYAENDDDRLFVENVNEIVYKNGGSVFFVHLTAPRDVLFSRVGNDSRKEFKKAHSRQELEWKLDEFNIEGQIGTQDSLVIDTSNQDAKMTASQIINHYDIEKM